MPAEDRERESVRLSSPVDVAIVIVARNQRSDVEVCLASLAVQTFDAFTVFLSDNGSTDGTAEWARGEHPGVTVIENGANLGFAEGSNVGVRLALGAGARHIVLLNPDTMVDATFLEELIRSAEASPAIGLCQSKIYRFPATTPPVVNTVGNRLHYTGLGWCGHLDEIDRGQFDEDIEIPYASGAALLIKAAVVREIGLLDADLFMYHEDLDWSVRARLRGHRIVLSHRSVVYHRYTFDKSASKFYFLERNRLIWLCKTYRGLFLFLLLPSLLALECAVLCYAAADGWLGVKLRSYVDFLRMAGRWRRTRRAVQSTRLLPDRCLVPILSSRLSCPGLDGSAALRLANNAFDWYWKFCVRFVR